MPCRVWAAVAGAATPAHGHAAAARAIRWVRDVRGLDRPRADQCGYSTGGRVTPPGRRISYTPTEVHSGVSRRNRRDTRAPELEECEGVSGISADPSRVGEVAAVIGKRQRRSGWQSLDRLAILQLRLAPHRPEGRPAVGQVDLAGHFEAESPVVGDVAFFRGLEVGVKTLRVTLSENGLRERTASARARTPDRTRTRTTPRWSLTHAQPRPNRYRQNVGPRTLANVTFPA